MLNWTDNTVNASLSYVPIRTSHVQMQIHKHEFLLLSPSIEIIHKHFAQDALILHEQCDLAISTLKEIENPIVQLCKLFDKPASMPKTLSPTSYHLMIMFYYIHEQVQITLSLVTLFRLVCRSKSKRALKQRQEIVDHLDIFMQGYDDIVQKMQDFTFLYDQIRFQEHGAGNNLREQ